MKRFLQQSLGSTAVEFAILAPVLALLLASLSDVTNLVGSAMIVHNAAREGARAASAYDASWSTDVTNYLSAAGVTAARGDTVGTPSLACGAPPGSACGAFPPATGTAVTVSVPVTVAINMPAIQQIVGQSVTITGSASMEMS